MTDRRKQMTAFDPDDRLLTYVQAAELLNTTPRFPRRLVEERRIRFVKVGRFVRIPESALREFIAAGLVEPVTLRGRHTRRAA
ncbi:excisionase family DNA-binding protein [Actinomadura opuntiae]|uniref:excisionase family DNA-binding protein n=1 Tax=Actinomadura sp. OS1-43 TaxID=604315 RepID=UPI00255AA853|nr:excisionase family DNA-binding protein [Actinomadura sp. OS1-43]MDL4819294.1 excisionase family DNA-binding protein [Actinomadura sp. OS1-43]